MEKQSDIFTFGKHKGTSLAEVVAEDPTYIQWLEENNVIDLPAWALDAASENVKRELPPVDMDDCWGDRS